MTTPSLNALPAHVQSDTDYWDDGECFQCGGEGYVYGCSWDWQCDIYDDGEGTCLCIRRCDVCYPVSTAVVIDKDGVRVSLPVKEK
jgi:hypothetical protein